MVPTDLVPVARETGCDHVQLFGQVRDDASGHCVSPAEEGTEEAHGRKLHSEPELVVVTVSTVDEPAVGSVQVEVLRELLLVRLASEAGVPSFLLRREKTDRHEPSLSNQGQRPTPVGHEPG